LDLKRYGLKDKSQIPPDEMEVNEKIEPEIVKEDKRLSKANPNEESDIIKVILFKKICF
jgi:hypothetical protein